MKRPIGPIYRVGRDRYGIDRCEPQIRAIQDGKIDFHGLTSGHYPGDPIHSTILPGLNSIGFWNARGAQDWGLDPHRNEGIEIVFLETGSMMFTVDDRSYPLRAGHFTITRPWQLHKLGDPNIGPGRLHWFIIDVKVRRPNQEWNWPSWMILTPKDLAELTRKLRHNENPVWNATPAIVQNFRSLAQCIQSYTKERPLSRIVIHLNHLMLNILDALTEQQKEERPDLTSRRRTVELFLKDLEQNPSSSIEPWTIERMSAHCGMGVTSFCKYCRELVNASPVEFLNQCRLQRASHALLEEREKSVTDIALEVGFNSSQYFATCFRHLFRVSPREFRKKKDVGRRK